MKTNNTVGEQITVEQLIEKRKVRTISKATIMHIGITSVSSRLKRFCIYYCRGLDTADVLVEGLSRGATTTRLA